MRLLNLLLLLASIGITSASCTKKEELPIEPKDKILSYKVNNVPDGEQIYGAINHQENSIKLYVPFYLGLEIIDPEIVLSEGAKLKEENLPVDVYSKDKTYTVIAADGSSKTYKLQIIFQEQDLKAYWTSNRIGVLFPRAQFPSITGNFGMTNPKLLKVMLSNQETKEVFQMNTSSGCGIRAQPDGNYLFSCIGLELFERIPATITEGTYTTSVTYLSQTVILETAFVIKYNQPGVFLPFSTIFLNKSADWNILPANRTVFLGLKKVTATIDQKEYTLIIKSWDRTSIKVQFPADFPTGTFPSVQLKFDFDGWKSVSRNASLQVSN